MVLVMGLNYHTNMTIIERVYYPLGTKIPKLRLGHFYASDC